LAISSAFLPFNGELRGISIAYGSSDGRWDDKRETESMNKPRQEGEQRAEGCPHCARIRQVELGNLENLVHQTRRAIVVAGDHQFFPGYCLVISKKHIREMHQISEEEALGLFADVLTVGRVIDENYHPLKMNYVSLGNVDEHLHWHVIPRYLSDPDCRDHPWKNSAVFSKSPTTGEIVENLRSMFSKS